jgi:hypothetical protein
LKTAIVIGASSGIGRALAVALYLQGVRYRFKKLKLHVAWVMRVLPDAVYARL